MRLPQKDWFSFFFQNTFWKTLPFIASNSVQNSRFLHLWDADDHIYHWVSLTKRLSYPGCVASKGTLDRVMLIDGILFVTRSLQDQQNDCHTQFLSIFFQILYLLNKIFGLILDANIGMHVHRHFGIIMHSSLHTVQCRDILEIILDVSKSLLNLIWEKIFIGPNSFNLRRRTQ